MPVKSSKFRPTARSGTILTRATPETADDSARQPSTVLLKAMVCLYGNVHIYSVGRYTNSHNLVEQVRPSDCRKDDGRASETRDKIFHILPDPSQYLIKGYTMMNPLSTKVYLSWALTGSQLDAIPEILNSTGKA